MRNLCSITLLSFFLIACNDKKEDLVNEVPKDGSIESSVSVSHFNDSFDIVTTKHIVHKNNFISKNIVHYDTVPSLGTTVVTDENNKNKMVKKDYDIYITVK